MVACPRCSLRHVACRWFVILCLFAAGLALSADEGKPSDDKPGSNPGGGKPTSALEATASAAEAPETGVPAGHSQHGEAFNDGPRQEAYLMTGTGKVHFTPSTSNELAAKFTLQGIGQLHGFWYFEAERSFRQVAMLDPDYAFAYWGMSMANVNNEKRARGFIEEAVERREHASPLERAMIDAHSNFLKTKDRVKRAKAYVAALESIIEQYPGEIEPKAFLAYLLWKHRGQVKRKSEETDKIIQAVLDVEPMHPVHHYRIHLWDLEKPSNALDSAAKCGPSAPAIAHMWHMPGHIYSRLKRYADAAWQQEASARVDHAHMMRDRVMPDQIHNFAHNNEWFIRNLIFIGRWRDGLDLAKNMTELPRHPRYNTFKRRGSASYGRQRLLQVLRSFELWQELITLANEPYLEPTDQPKLQIERLRWLGVAHARLGHNAEAESVRSDLIQRRNKLQRTVEAAKSATKAVTKEAAPKKAAPRKTVAKKAVGSKPANSGTVAKGKGKTRRKPSPEAIELKGVERALSAIDGYLAWHRKDWEAARKQLKAAGEDELVLIRLQSEAGEHKAAVEAMARVVKQRANQVLPLAAQIEILHRAGRMKEAKDAFERLRSISGEIQLEAPPFERLRPIAAEFDLAEDWRQEQPLAKDLGQRPSLDSLGPFRWAPQEALPWELQDIDGKTYSLKQYEGRPVIVIFYLGFGCLHCAEQLRAFAPMADAFRENEIELIAVSTDGREDLKKSIDDYPGGMPFPLVSDQKLKVFHSYRVYDDFESTPLHGTFLIDSEGKVRWQDISYEPFMEPKFLLRESLRLLGRGTDSQHGVEAGRD